MRLMYQAALAASMGDYAKLFITVSMVLFAFTTLLGNLYYVDNAFAYVLKHVPGKTLLCATAFWLAILISSVPAPAWVQCGIGRCYHGLHGNYQLACYLHSGRSCSACAG